LLNHDPGRRNLLQLYLPARMIGWTGVVHLYNRASLS
jgi:hypothetical protein